MQILRKYRSGLRLTALITLLALIGGCSSTAENASAPSAASSASAPKTSDTSQTSATSTDEPSTSESSSASSATADTPSPSKTSGPIYFKSQNSTKRYFAGADSVWNGGIFTMPTSGLPASAAAWKVGMQEFSNCSPELLKDNELAVENGETSANQGWVQSSIWATTGTEPQAYYAYAVKKKASGLNPESLHAYIQPIDLEDCTLGERVDVIGADVPADAILNPKFIASTDDTLVVSLFGGEAFQRIIPNLPSVIGYNVKTKAVTWKKTIRAKKYSASSTFLPSVFSLQITQDDSKYITSISSAKDGSPIAESSGRNNSETLKYNSLSPLGDGKIYYNEEDAFGKSQASIFDGTKAVPVKGGKFESAHQSLDANGVDILVGIYSDEVGKKSLGWLGSDGTFKPILSAEQTTSLDLKVLGAASGQVYVETTAERVVVGLDGKQIGDGYSEEDQPYIPLTQQKVGSDIYTIWGISENSTMSSQFPVAITKNEMTPPSSTPGK